MRQRKGRRERKERRGEGRGERRKEQENGERRGRRIKEGEKGKRTKREKGKTEGGDGRPRGRGRESKWGDGRRDTPVHPLVSIQVLFCYLVICMASYYTHIIPIIYQVYFHIWDRHCFNVLFIKS